ncbi:MAG TPA: aconitate hydratase AcnA [Marinagarivorans sp.]
MSQKSTPHGNRTTSFDTQRTLTVGERNFTYFDITQLPSADKVERLPFCLKVLLENLLRHESADDGGDVSARDIQALVDRDVRNPVENQVSFSPARVVLQDFTGVPAIVDLAAMRDAIADLGGDAKRINPIVPVDLVIDHSVMVDAFGSSGALKTNTDKEFERNGERYQFLRWGQKAFNNFRVVPPGTGIVHQVNLEYLASVVTVQEPADGEGGLPLAIPDTLVGTDSHTTMINGLGVLGWGVGGIEAEAAMLGQPISMVVPDVVGFKLDGALPEGATATDLVLVVTQILRNAGVVGKFVEFYGDGLANLPLADRATIANMAPEYGATCGIFPIDGETLRYLRLSGRDEAQVQLIEAYAKAQTLWREEGEPEADYNTTLALDLSTVVPSIAGPKRPQDRIALTDAQESFRKHLRSLNVPAVQEAKFADEGGHTAVGAEQPEGAVALTLDGQECWLKHGDIVIAAITSCTNTSNPAVMMAAGLVAQKAVARGMQVKPWVKTSLAPGSQVVPAYLQKANLLDDLAALGFDVVGFGCTTCIGNSGPLPEAISDAINGGDLTVCSVLSGNRNFEGRIHSDVKANFLASPPLVVAYALAGTMDIDLTKEPVGADQDGLPVYLKDIWPSQQEIADLLTSTISASLYQQYYSDVFKGTEAWRSLPTPEGETYQWPASTYVRKPPYFAGMRLQPEPPKAIEGARCLVRLGDSITTDHISPAGAISPKSPAGQYLLEEGVQLQDFNSLGSRRGNHDVMVRGTFANPRLRNQLAPGSEGSMTLYFPTGETTSIYDAAMRYQADATPLIVLAGKEYGTGSSRDWAAKGVQLLGVKAVIAQSYERIHRSNLVGFGVLPLEFKSGDDATSLGLRGDETFSVSSLENQPTSVTVTARKADGDVVVFDTLVRIQTPKEWDYYRNGGILHYVLRGMAA